MSEFLGWLLFAATISFVLGFFIGLGFGGHHEETQWRNGMRRFRPTDKGLPFTREPQ